MGGKSRTLEDSGVPLLPPAVFEQLERMSFLEVSNADSDRNCFVQPVHGGLTWPGRPQPKWPTQDDWLTLLPKPMRNPVKEFLRKRAMDDM